jgi:hypothetical protein
MFLMRESPAESPAKRLRIDLLLWPNSLPAQSFEGVIQAAAKATQGQIFLEERTQFLPDFGDAFTPPYRKTKPVIWARACRQKTLMGLRWWFT